MVWENPAHLPLILPMAAPDTVTETATETSPVAGTHAAHDGLIAPHGGSLVDLMVPEAEREAVRASADRRLECSDRNACDVELLVVGGFSPLRGFMHQEDYEAVVAGNRTTSGLLFGLPIVIAASSVSSTIGRPNSRPLVVRLPATTAS